MDSAGGKGVASWPSLHETEKNSSLWAASLHETLKFALSSGAHGLLVPFVHGISFSFFHIDHFCLHRMSPSSKSPPGEGVLSCFRVCFFCLTVLHRVSNFTRLSEPVSNGVSYYELRDINLDVLDGFLSLVLKRVLK